MCITAMFCIHAPNDWGLDYIAKIVKSIPPVFPRVKTLLTLSLGQPHVGIMFPRTHDPPARSGWQADKFAVGSPDVGALI